MKIGRSDSTIDHLLFADDVLLFGRANVQEATALCDCLTHYCSWSGQAINLDKSGIFFL